MSTLTLVDAGNTGETRSQAVTRRLREELGRVGLSVSAVARLLGENQPKLSRRMTGLIPWDVDTLSEFCTAAGISYDYVTTGIRELPEPPNSFSAPLGRQGGDRGRGVEEVSHLRLVDADIDDAYVRLAEGKPPIEIEPPNPPKSRVAGGGDPLGAPTRTRTWDLRIIRTQHAA